jgi:hypothetical protein
VNIEVVLGSLLRPNPFRDGRVVGDLNDLCFAGVNVRIVAVQVDVAGPQCVLPVGVVAEPQDHRAQDVVRPAGDTEPEVAVHMSHKNPRVCPAESDLTRISLPLQQRQRRGDGTGRRFGERVQAVVDDPNQIGDRVRAGVAGAVLNGEGFAGAVSETRDRVEPEPAFVVAFGVFLF